MLCMGRGLIVLMGVTLATMAMAEDMPPRLLPEDLADSSYDEIYKYVVDHIIAERVSEIEPLFDYARENRLQTENNDYVLTDRLHSAIENFMDSAGGTRGEWLRSVVFDWADTAPESATAQSLRLSFMVDLAWELRGSAYASETSAQEFEGFQDVIDEAIGYATQYRELLADDPVYYRELIALQMATSQPFDSLIDSVEGYLRTQPDDIWIYSTAAMACLPRWSGSNDWLLALARHGYEHNKERFGMAAYIIVAKEALDNDDLELTFGDYGFNIDNFLKSADDYEKYRIPHWDWSINVAAQTLCLLGDRDRAKAYFDRTSDDPVQANVWVVAEYNDWRDWANGEGPAPKTRAIHKAAKEGDLAYFENAVDRKTDLDVSNLTGETAIHIAGDEGHWELVRYLAQNGANPNIGPMGHTPLSNAISAGESETALVLIDNGADPNYAWRSSNVPIYLAVNEGLPEVVEALATHADIQIDRRGYSRRTTSLQLAVRRQNMEIVKILLANGASPDVTNRLLFSPLSTAAAMGTVPLVEVLLQEGADPNLRTGGGDTALQVASMEGQADTVELLVAHPEMRVNQRNYVNDTALIAAAAHGSTPIVKMLLEHPDIDTDVQSDRNGRTALHEAADKGSMGVVRALIKAGADQSLKAADGRTAAEIARDRGFDRLLKFFD